MNPEIEKFIARVNRLEIRYKNDKYADSWLVPREELTAVRDELIQPTLELEKDETECPDYI